MTVLELTTIIGPNTRILVHDRTSDDGTVYDGSLLAMPGRWNRREVVWLRPCKGGIILEIE